ncbi:MAG: single-stranded-DNA-specific exonuclease RecJ [Bacteroidales bacterium]|uniref:single-stranded-DNA-specific exonuclease RecJ n=1 Tax=Candidatus Cryptobacteroides sp. TaxID=2952915 RepID=UPI002A750F94|nr:single-stranded-DNA-specific exonuclease RecJ [Candidatus Cryptobacteroides sp.]MBS7277294.1 single-stranded-DNA-specific exonuclease RecJ [Bacteroidales bacterium]MCI6527303.1 single-stranded-DNA-specific exonuclease RecJ [Bacteroidales bacterium]MDD5914416.1 single-stranded-DNA-specific exonuclease RecJ [Bacteroidales bacterium]MDD7135147.1 single-stranded-DNA-specific exonuclease RecJ [Bacteroidales bacterium]MDD7234568.1 single-stranded-DNA-specific exonuclease RecJ [Bacteroidales bacte
MTKERKWILKDPADPEKVGRLSAELGIDRVLAELLVKRGVETFEQARSFFRPSLDDLHDPFLMKDMDKAVKRLRTAITTEEGILVYGDYDVDGTTAVALVYSFLRRYSTNVDFYIPDRYEDGYGLSYRGIDWAKEHGFSLIITLDCGIKANEKVDYAASLGLDVIICDHHLPESTIPAAVAVLDPKREDDNYPFDDLSGCGVGFKLVQAYSREYDIPFETLIPLLDLLVVSISADLVSMTGENRVLAHFGLRQLNENPRKGLQAIATLSKLEPGHLSIDDIVFKIGPRINAAGRMESGRLAVELLTSSDEHSAAVVGEKINDNNNERKSIDREITQEALEMVQSGAALSSSAATIVYNPNWNKGVVGIVASRLVEAFYKPTIVLTKSNDFITGSARSVAGFDLYEAIDSCADLMENFGGHVYAAGLTLREENLPEFVRRIEEFISTRITQEMLTPFTEIDARLEFSQITPKFFRLLKQFQPFGPGNTNPVFQTENVYDGGKGRKVGADGVHMKLDLIDEKQPFHQIPAIAFNMSEYFDYIKAGNPFDICYSIVENYYRGNSTLQLRIKDIREREEPI